MSDFFFNPDEQEGSNFEPIPAGEYVAEIVDVAISQPKSDDGHMLRLVWRVVEGDFENRQVWQTLCYQHSNPTTQDIARKMLKDICVALDINEQISDPEIFKFKPARVRVDIESDKYGQYEDQNKIKRVKPLTKADNEAQEAKPAAAAPKPAPKPAGTGPGAAPWKQTKPAA